MKVLLTGACGYIGAATLEALVAVGQDVIGITRSEARAESIRQQGAVARVGDVRDTAFMAAMTATVDGGSIWHPPAMKPALKLKKLSWPLSSKALAEPIKPSCRQRVYGATVVAMPSAKPRLFVHRKSPLGDQQ